MILDATAGNRVIWREKNPIDIIFIDIQTKLERKPTIFADHRLTPFKDKIFDTIFYDPPHSWNTNHVFYGYPDKNSWHKNHPLDNRQYPTYYGMDIYKTKSALIKSIYQALNEFDRILKDDGLLWLNWSEIRYPLFKILALLQEWNELIRLYVTSKFQNSNDCKNYWICFQKKSKDKRSQTRLDKYKII